MSGSDFFTSSPFDASHFTPRWQCGDWSTLHGVLDISSDVSIALAYFALSAFLYLLVRNRQDVPYPGVFRLFSAFILVCGVTHLVGTLMFVWPAYRLLTLFKMGTSAVSVATAVYVVSRHGALTRLKSADAWEAQIRLLEDAHRDLRHANRNLQQQLLYRGLLEKELDIIRTIQYAKNQCQVDRVVATLDGICTDLKDLMPPGAGGDPNAGRV